MGVQSEYVVRGYSVSAGQPAAVLNLAYDDPRGFYANASAIADLDADDRPAFLGGIANIGYARQLNPELSLDGGVLRTQYRQRDGVQTDTGYTEGYLGAIGRNLSARIYYSPDYYVSGTHTVYGELEANHGVWAGISLRGHLGYLAYVANAPGYSKRHDQYDWRITASRPIHSFVLFTAVSGGGPGRDYYSDQAHSKTTVMGGVSWAF